MKHFSKDILKIEDIESTVNQLAQKLKEDIYLKCKRKGAVIGISGGIDSSVCLALAVKALGPEKVFGIMMPEKDSSPDSLELADKLAKVFGVKTIVENISSALEGFRCYERRDEATKRVFPEFDPSIHKMKIGIKESGLYSNLPPLFYITIIDQPGNEKTERLPANEFRIIMAASDFKQRSRMSILYYHAERLHYAVVGTPNKHEENQGFFVKYGDGGADVMPIAHLYKTQVYQLADYLNIPREIIDRTPTTDTYSAEQTQEEFFFQLPFKQMDLLWYAYENKYDLKEVTDVVGKSVEEVEKIFSNFKRKQSTTEYLRMAPIKYF
ncbi:MAG: NAD(+) synthase [Bacteroidales bacterium]|nr:NAD(+) synthase [Bacteroidales bacterium]